MRAHVPASLLAALGLAIAPAAARAQNVPAACRPLIDAEKKEIMTPHHMYMTETADGPGTKPTASEAISTGDVTYIMTRGKWIKSPMGPKESLDRLQENLATAKSYACQHAGDESVNGEAAAVYTAQSDNEDVKASTRTWIGKGSGLMLRQEEDMDIGGPGGKRHMSVRWEYTGVRAPAGVSAP
jgi:hypothetical protein